MTSRQISTATTTGDLGRPRGRPDDVIVTLSFWAKRQMTGEAPSEVDNGWNGTTFRTDKHQRKAHRETCQNKTLRNKIKIQKIIQMKSQKNLKAKTKSKRNKKNVFKKKDLKKAQIW